MVNNATIDKLLNVNKNGPLLDQFNFLACITGWRCRKKEDLYYLVLNKILIVVDLIFYNLMR